MTLDGILADLGCFTSKIWNIPDGFATLIAGSFVLVAAIIAWRSVRKQIASERENVQKQIATQREIESDRKRHDRQILETGLTAELHCYSASIIEATSCWNVRALKAPDAPISTSPQLLHPYVYKAVIARIGLLSEGWPANAVIGFYGNLLELNDMAMGPISGPRTIGENTGRVARRLQKMAINLAQALDD
jgi:hypothetical protein